MNALAAGFVSCCAHQKDEQNQQHQKAAHGQRDDGVLMLRHQRKRAVLAGNAVVGRQVFARVADQRIADAVKLRIGNRSRYKTVSVHIERIVKAVGVGALILLLNIRPECVLGGELLLLRHIVLIAAHLKRGNLLAQIAAF